jgi:hypothetical protein
LRRRFLVGEFFGLERNVLQQRLQNLLSGDTENIADDVSHLDAGCVQHLLNPVLLAAQVSQKLLAPARQIPPFHDSALRQKAPRKQPVALMQRQIDGVSKIRFVSFLRMVFARTDQRHPQIVLQFVFYGNPPAPGTFQGN